MIRHITVILFLSLSCSWLLAQDSAPEEKVLIEQIPGTDVSFSMTYIPAGSFMLGSPESEENRNDDEGPQQEVSMNAFWMGTYEVSYEMYELFMDIDKDSDTSLTDVSYDKEIVTRPSPPYEDPTFGMGKYGYPAGSMTQYAALQFCKWLSEKTGHFYRLPTEVEWEYACKAGSTTAYYFGDDPEDLDDYAWYYENSDGVYHKLGEKEPNAFGLYDMLGNVAEWTLDQYQSEYYSQLTSDNPTGHPWALPTRLHPRTVKGGSYDDDPEWLRSSARLMSNMAWKARDPQIPKSFWWNTDSPFVGLRLVRPAGEITQAQKDAFWGIALDE